MPNRHIKKVIPKKSETKLPLLEYPLKQKHPVKNESVNEKNLSTKTGACFFLTTYTHRDVALHFVGLQVQK